MGAMGWGTGGLRLIELMSCRKLWPAVTAFSFTFIPPQNRNIFAGCIAIFWQTYLSWLNKNAEKAEMATVKEVGEALAR